MDMLAEFRRRLDVAVDEADDALLGHFLDVAQGALSPWLRDDVAAYQPNVDEATVQLAVKLWGTSTSGVNAISPDGQWITPAPSASPNLVRSVWGALGPALRRGGLTV